MKRLYTAALVYLVFGLLAGVYYRELTKANDFTGDTQLATLHTHLLTLGTIIFLVVLVLEKVFTLSASPKLFNWFFWVYNAGLALTLVMMTVNGTLRVLGTTTGAAVSGIAGMGHIILSAGLILLFVALGRRVKVAQNERDAISPKIAS